MTTGAPPGGRRPWRLLVGALLAGSPLLIATLLTLVLPGRPERAPEPAAPALDLSPVPWTGLRDWPQDDPTGALAAFRRSCEVLRRRPAGDAMGRDPRFGAVADWLGPCDRANAVPADAAAVRGFFEADFVPLAASDGGEAEGLFTGYYEPLLMGARAPDERFRFPLHRRPADLVTVELARFDAELEGRRLVGRVVEGRLLPYPDRAEIDRGTLAGQGAELLWVDDPIAKFFLQIQGSGQVELPDGSRVRVGYAEQNGHPYRAIGRDLVEMGAIPRAQVSMQAIRDWLRAHPEQAQEVMAKNRSYVFFQELPELAAADGPLGAQNVPLTPGRSLAVDRRFLPLGVPIWLETTAPMPTGTVPFNRLVVAQDTGGAIRGPVRGDVFWGAGDEAEHAAGHMQSRGRYFVLVPRALALTS